MSDTSTLIHEYEVSRRLAERMNHASLTMKRSRRRATSPNELNEARRVAAEALAKVLQMLTNAPVTEEPEIPRELIADLRERHGRQMAHFREDITTAIKDLLAGQTSEDAIEAVDLLSQSADSIASASFRRLRRR